jgi:outer membrane lipoprotein-sorting protein
MLTRLFAAPAVCAIVLTVGATPAPAPTLAPLDAATVLQRSEAKWQGLSSYQVPVTIAGSVRVAFISVPVHMTGTQYYKAPDEQALHLNNPPSYARGLGDTLSTMGTPQTWLRDYAIAAPASQPHGHHTAYVLVGTPKKSGSRVKSMTMAVSATTYVIESITFAYTNGASLVVTFLHHSGISQYRLARSATVAAHFPSYSGSATITYGSYQLNQPIPASVFQQTH